MALKTYHRSDGVPVKLGKLGHGYADGSFSGAIYIEHLAALAPAADHFLRTRCTSSQEHAHFWQLDIIRKGSKYRGRQASVTDLFVFKQSCQIRAKHSSRVGTQHQSSAGQQSGRPFGNRRIEAGSKKLHDAITLARQRLIARLESRDEPGP